MEGVSISHANARIFGYIHAGQITYLVGVDSVQGPWHYDMAGAFERSYPLLVWGRQGKQFTSYTSILRSGDKFAKLCGCHTAKRTEQQHIGSNLFLQWQTTMLNRSRCRMSSLSPVLEFATALRSCQ